MSIYLHIHIYTHVCRYIYIDIYIDIHIYMYDTHHTEYFFFLNASTEPRAKVVCQTPSKGPPRSVTNITEPP